MTNDGRCATAEYIVKMCDELAVLAASNGFDMGSYLLRMTSIEFQNQWFELAQKVESTETAR
jgi:hypothetical protein